MTRSEQDEVAAKNGTTIKADEQAYAEYINKNINELFRCLGGKSNG